MIATNAALFDVAYGCFGVGACSINLIAAGTDIALGAATTSSPAMRGRTGTVRTIRARHRWDRLAPISQIAY
jgi:fructose-1,6-bisphosphatase/sedoheptulose 1,7-bisphosphatase-like protein